MGKAKDALARVGKKGKSIAKSAYGEKGAGLGKAGHEIVEGGTAAIAMVMTKKMPEIPFLPVSPDAAITGVGALLWLWPTKHGGKKRRSLGRAIAKGGGFAMLARAILVEDDFKIISGPNGEKFVAQREKQKPKGNTTINVNVDAGGIGADAEQGDEEEEQEAA